MELYRARNPIEAHLIVEALRQEGVEAFADETALSLAPTNETVVHIRDSREEVRARNILEEIVAPPSPKAEPASSGKAWFLGVVLGIGLGVLGTLLVNIIYKAATVPSGTDSWDLNGDGAPDQWATFTVDGRYLESKTDRNLDGKPDSWQEFDPPGTPSFARYDSDFDGEPDHWEEFSGGVVVSFTSDNDRDGRVDEWGLLESGSIVERHWSFLNDGVIDKKAFYRNGRRIREEYDHDRDGTFDEKILLDAFERPVRTVSGE
jgi:hypothetical protein